MRILAGKRTLRCKKKQGKTVKTYTIPTNGSKLTYIQGKQYTKHEFGNVYIFSLRRFNKHLRD